MNVQTNFSTYVGRFASGIIALIFGMAVAAKLTAQSQFIDSLRVSRLVPGYGEYVLGPLIITAEIAVVACMLWPSKRTVGFKMVSALSAMFFGYHAWRIYNHIKVPCECFGFWFKMSPSTGLAINLGLTALSSIGIVLLAKQRAPVTK